MSDRKPRILAVDDDQEWLDMLPMVFEDECQVDTFTTIDQGISAVESQFYDIILLDLNFDGDSRTGHDVFRHIYAADRGADVIVISGETRPDKLIEILNAGVTQFIPKPAGPDSVRSAVRSTLEQRELRLRAVNMAAQDVDSVHLIGGSPEMRKLRENISRIVRDGIKDILILGETGTGKEVVAKMISQMADPSKRLIPIHCGAISDGLAESELFGHVKGAFTGADRDRVSAFEAAGGGFIFFDELGDMPLVQQSKLLRVLQERKVQRVGSHDEKAVSFRSISATNVHLDKAIANKTFREDLFYRIAKETLKVPALRDRTEDIPELVEYFLARAPKQRRKTMTNEGLALLQAYHWPGNVRQLKTVVESLESRCSERVIREKDICQVIPELAGVLSSRFKKALIGKYGCSPISQERNRLAKAILQANGDRTKAAEILGMSRATFFRRARELGLSKVRIKSQTEAMA